MCCQGWGGRQGLCWSYLFHNVQIQTAVKQSRPGYPLANQNVRNDQPYTTEMYFTCIFLMLPRTEPLGLIDINLWGVRAVLSGKLCPALTRTRRRVPSQSDGAWNSGRYTPSLRHGHHSRVSIAVVAAAAGVPFPSKNRSDATIESVSATFTPEGCCSQSSSAATEPTLSHVAPPHPTCRPHAPRWTSKVRVSPPSVSMTHPILSPPITLSPAGGRRPPAAAAHQPPPRLLKTPPPFEEAPAPPLVTARTQPQATQGQHLPLGSILLLLKHLRRRQPAQVAAVVQSKTAPRCRI